MSRLTLAELIVTAVNTGKIPADLQTLDAITGATIANGDTVSKINDPTGGTTVDTEARAAINAIINALEAFKISTP